MTFIEYSSAKYDNVYMRGISYYNEMTNVGGVFFVWYKISIAPEGNRQTTLRMDRHETIVAERCETFRYYCIVGVLG